MANLCINNSNIISIEPLLQFAPQASELLRALGNEYRLIILCHLLEGEHQVAQLQEKINLSQSSLSQHLARLRHEGIVSTRRESQAVFYSISADVVRQVLAVLHNVYCSSKLKGTIL